MIANESPDLSAPPASDELIPVVGGLDVHCPRCGARLLTSHIACPQCGVAPTSAEASSRAVRRGSPSVEVLRGVAYLPRALGTIVTRPRTWPVMALPLLLNVVFAIGVSYIIVPQLANWLAWLTSPYALADWTGWWTPPRLAIVFLGWLVRGAAFFTIPGITAWVLSTPPFRVLCAASAAIVSARFERDILRLGRQDPFEELKLGRSVAAAIVSSLGLMAIETALYLLLLPIALIPFVGTFAWLVAPRALVAGLDQTDPLLVRKMYYPSEKLAIWWAHRWRILGFGCAVVFVLGVPFVNAVVLAIAPVAATLLFLELEEK